VSDFDDEPTEGLDANDEADEVAEPPRKARSKPVPDDDWDDEEAAAPRRRAKAKPVVDEDDDWDDDWDDDDDRGGPKRDMTVVWAIVAAAIVIVIAVVLTRPSDDGSDGGGNSAAGGTSAPAEVVKNWQGDVADAVGPEGADAQARAESADGVYIWTDFGGWHVRSNGDQEVTVVVAADQVRQTGEGGDEEFATETTLTLPAGDGATGADLDLGNSESATFTVSIGGTNVAADQIFLGGAEGVAEQNPVTFTKS
jgi:hypothetical protein